MCICGNNKCKGLCDISVGRRIYEFYRNWTSANLIEDVDIGAVEIKNPGSKEYIIVRGIKFYSPSENVLENRSRILSNENAIKGIRVTNLFSMDAQRVTSYLKAYFDKFSGIPGYENCRRTIIDLMTWKKVLIPINPESSCDVMVHKVDIDKVRNYMAKSVIKYIQWCADENGELTCTIRVLPEKDKVSTERDITTFGKELIDRTISGMMPDRSYEVVQMSRFGYIKPIVITAKGQTVVIDNCSVYLGDSLSSLEEIGNWDGNSINYKRGKHITDKQIIALINEYKPYLAVTRKKMAPYLVGESNLVKIGF